MTPQPTNEGGSEARMMKDYMSHGERPLRIFAAAWNVQEEYWSKRCEAMEKALEKISNFNYYHESSRLAREALKAGGKE